MHAKRQPRGTIHPMTPAATPGGHQVTWPIPDPDTLVLAGDWHGNTQAAAIALDAAEQLDAPLVLQLGDFGLWPGHEGAHYITELDTIAGDLGVIVAWIDGNHEDFTQLKKIPHSSDGLQWVTPRIARIPRGSRWTWHGVRFAALGGATSLDKPHRTPGKSWWIEESVNDNDLELLAAGGDCDVLLTHDCPTGVAIPGIEHRNYSAAMASGWPIRELERAWDHRDLILEAVRATHPSHLWHGHYHLHYEATATLHDGGPTQVNGLSWDGDALAKRIAVVELTPGHVTLVNVHHALERQTHTQSPARDAT